MLPPVIVAELPRLTNRPANPGDTTLMVEFIRLAVEGLVVFAKPPPTRTPPLHEPPQITLAPFSVSVAGGGPGPPPPGPTPSRTPTRTLAVVQVCAPVAY